MSSNYYFSDKFGFKHEFATRLDCQNFLDAEVEFWRQKLSELENIENNLQFTGDISYAAELEYIEEMTSLLKNVAYAVFNEHANGRGLIINKDNNKQFKETWISSKSAFTQRWVELSAKNRSTGNAFFSAIILKDSSHSSNFDFMQGYMAAYEFVAEAEPKTTSRVDLERARLNDVFLTTTRLNSKTVQDSQKTLEKIESLFTSNESTWKENLNTLEHTYREKLRLSGPAEYWAKKAKGYAKQGTVFASLLLTILIATAITLGGLFHEWMDGTRSKIDLSSIEGAFIFAAFLSTIVLATRMLSKLAFSAYHLQRDAEEREQLTHLYLSLTKERDLDEATRQIVIQALFSRSETGLISNETGPTMPGITELITAARKPTL